MKKKHKFSSSLWSNYEDPFCAWHFNWGKGKVKLVSSFRQFLNRYIEISSKNNMMIPFDLVILKKDPYHMIDKVLKDSEHGYENFIQENKNNPTITNPFFQSNSFSLNRLFYSIEKGWKDIFLNKLYSYNDKNLIECDYIVDVEYLNALKQKQLPQYVESPISINHLQDISVWLRSDFLFSNIPLYNRKISNLNRDAINNYKTDNYELALLNAPRFNSFLRDFRELCVDFGASCSFDIFREDKQLCDQGIVIDSELLFLEDISDILPNSTGSAL